MTVKFHAAKKQGAFAWIACGTTFQGNSAHGGMTTVEDFKKLDPNQQCKKCAAKIKMLKL